MTNGSLIPARPCAACMQVPEGGGRCEKCGATWAPDERGTLQQVSLVAVRESVDATHDWIREHVGDHAYAHGLADDVFSLLRLLTRAADALHDAAWVMEGAKTEWPLSPPVTFVLPQTKTLEAEIRAVLDAE